MLFFLIFGTFFASVFASSQKFYIREGEKQIIYFDEAFPQEEVNFEYKNKESISWFNFQNVLNTNFTDEFDPLSSKVLFMNIKTDRYFALLENLDLVQFSVSADLQDQVKFVQKVNLKDQVKKVTGNIKCSSFIFAETQSIVVVSCLDQSLIKNDKQFTLIVYETKLETFEYFSIPIGSLKPVDSLLEPMKLLLLNLGRKEANYFVVYSKKLSENGKSTGFLVVYKMSDFNQLEVIGNEDQLHAKDLEAAFTSGGRIFIFTSDKQLKRYLMSTNFDEFLLEDSVHINGMEILKIERNPSLKEQTVFCIDSHNIIYEAVWKDKNQDLFLKNAFKYDHQNISMFNTTNEFVYVQDKITKIVSVYNRNLDGEGIENFHEPLYEIDLVSYLASGKEHPGEEDKYTPAMLLYVKKTTNYFLSLAPDRAKLITVSRAFLEIDCLTDYMTNPCPLGISKGLQATGSSMRVIDVKMEALDQSKENKTRSFEIEVLPLNSLNYFQIADPQEQKNLTTVSSFLINYPLNNLFFGDFPTSVSVSSGTASLVKEDNYAGEKNLVKYPWMKKIVIYENGVNSSDSLEDIWVFEIIQGPSKNESYGSLHYSQVDFSILIFKNQPEFHSYHLHCHVWDDSVFLSGIESSWIECERLNLGLGDFLSTQIKGALSIELFRAGSDFFLLARMKENTQLLFHNETTEKYMKVDFDNQVTFKCDKYTAIRYNTNKVGVAAVCSQYNKGVVIYKNHDMISSGEFVRFDNVEDEKTVVRLSPVFENILFIQVHGEIHIFSATEGKTLRTLTPTCPDSLDTPCDGFDFEIIDNFLVVVMLRSSSKVVQVQIHQLDSKYLDWTLLLQVYTVEMFCSDKHSLTYNSVRKTMSVLATLPLDCSNDDNKKTNSQFYFLNLLNKGPMNPYYATSNLKDHTSISVLTEKRETAFWSNVIYIASLTPDNPKILVITRVFDQIYLQSKQPIEDHALAGSSQFTPHIQTDLNFTFSLSKSTAQPSFSFKTTVLNDFTSIKNKEEAGNYTLNLNHFRNTSENFYDFYLDTADFFYGNIYSYSFSCQMENDCDEKDPYVVMESPVKLLGMSKNLNFQYEKQIRSLGESNYFLIGEILEIYHSDSMVEANEFLYLPILTKEKIDYVIPDCSKFIVSANFYVFFCGHESFSLMIYEKNGHFASVTQFQNFTSYCSQKITFLEELSEGWLFMVCFNAPFSIMLVPAYGLFKIEKNSTSVWASLKFIHIDQTNSYLSTIATKITKNKNETSFLVFCLTKETFLEACELGIHDESSNISKNTLGTFYLPDLVEEEYRDGLEQASLLGLMAVPGSTSFILLTKHFFNLVFDFSEENSLALNLYICPFRYLETQWGKIQSDILVLKVKDLRTGDDNLAFYNISAPYKGFLFSFQLVNISSFSDLNLTQEIKDFFFTVVKHKINGEIIRVFHLYALFYETQESVESQTLRAMTLKFNLTTTLNVRFNYNLVNSRALNIYARNLENETTNSTYVIQITPYQYKNSEIIMQAAYLVGLCAFAILLIGWFFFDNQLKQRREKKKAIEKAEAEKKKREAMEVKSKEMVLEMDHLNGQKNKKYPQKSFLAVLGKVNENPQNEENEEQEESLPVNEQTEV